MVQRYIQDHYSIPFASACNPQHVPNVQSAFPHREAHPVQPGTTRNQPSLHPRENPHPSNPIACISLFTSSRSPTRTNTKIPHFSSHSPHAPLSAIPLLGKWCPPPSHVHKTARYTTRSRNIDACTVGAKRRTVGAKKCGTCRLVPGYKNDWDAGGEPIRGCELSNLFRMPQGEILREGSWVSRRVGWKGR